MQKSSSTRLYPVKMSIEVPFTSHSHIIGRGGQLINSVMKETTTKIHFPDENRMTGEKKSNVVTIAGELANVEEARQYIRSLIPVEFVIGCPADKLDARGRAALVKEFATRYGVLVRLNDRTSGPSNYSVTVRGSQKELGRLRDALLHLMKDFNILDGVVAMKMEVSSDTFRTMEAHLYLLENEYGVTFHVFQLTHEREDHQAVWIRGTLQGVYQAKLALMELLPLKLMFHVHAAHLNFGVNERKLAKRLDVAVKMEPSSKPSSFLLHVISYEKNAGNIYEFRRQILRLPHPSGLAPIGSPRSLPKVQEPLGTFLFSGRTITPHPRFRDSVDNHPCPVLPSPPLPLPDQLSVFQVPVDQTTIPASLCALKFDPNSHRQLRQLLWDAKLSQYSDLFLENEVDLAMFSTLEDNDLKSIGISSYPARKLMLQAIGELRGKPVSRVTEEPFPLYQQF